MSHFYFIFSDVQVFDSFIEHMILLSHTYRVHKNGIDMISKEWIMFSITYMAGAVKKSAWSIAFAVGLLSWLVL